MGLPDNRDIEPTRDDSFADFDNAPDFVVVNRVEDNERMEVDGDDPDSDNGYLRLQMFDNGDEIPANDSDSSGDEEADDYAFSYDQENIPEEPPSSGIPEIVPSDVEIQAQVWNSPRQDDSIELNSEKTQQILAAMSNFSLKNVPAWATEVNPSELVQRIKNKGSPLSSDKT